MAKLNVHNKDNRIDFTKIQFGIEVEEYVYTSGGNIKCLSSTLEKVSVKSIEELNTLTQVIAQFNEASREISRTTKTSWKVKKLIKL